MNNYIIHHYMDNRRSLIQYLNSIGYKNSYYITNDIEDENLLSYEMINTAILITNNTSINLSGRTKSLPALLQRILKEMRIHTFYCSGNVHKGVFKTVRNNDCGFHKKETFDYLYNNPDVIKDNTNYYLNINSRINMNTERAFRYHDLIKDYSNNLFIKKINNPKSSKLSFLKLNHDHLDYNFFNQVLSSIFYGNPKKLPIMDKHKTELCKISYYKKFEQIIEPEIIDNPKILPEPKNQLKAIEIWNNAVAVLLSEDRSPERWLSSTKPHDYNYQDQTFKLTCDNHIVSEMIDTRLRGSIESIISNQLDKEMKIEIL